MVGDGRAVEGRWGVKEGDLLGLLKRMQSGEGEGARAWLSMWETAEHSRGEVHNNHFPWPNADVATLTHRHT